MVRSSDATREPCPDRILDDLGGGFAMGAVSGSIFHFLKGASSHPNGERLAGGFLTARMSAARIAGAWAAWSAVYSASDCALVFLRQKEDPWNSILAGFSTGGALSWRRGLRPAVGSALAVAGFMALVEGFMVASAKFEANHPRIFMDPSRMPYDLADQTVPKNDVPEGNAFPRWFRGSKKKESGGESEPKVLDSFDIDSPTPMPTFEYER